MSLTNVKMSEEVWLTCVTHALSTETEEIMGLLLGDIECSKSGKSTALIWGTSPQTRSDRRKDRVETNPEQLVAASAMAEVANQQAPCNYLKTVKRSNFISSDKFMLSAPTTYKVEQIDEVRNIWAEFTLYFKPRSHGG